jgi:peptidoglycan-binding protein ArfA
LPDLAERRRPRRALLVAVVAVVVLVAGIWWVLHRSSEPDAADTPRVEPPTTSSAPRAPEMNFAPLSIALTDKGFRLGGELPTQEAKTSLVQSLKLAFGSGLQVTDNTVVKPGVNAPDFAALGSILGSAVGVTGFTFDLKGDTVTLGGTASSADAKTEVQSAVTAAWPKMKVVNKIAVK